MPECYSVLVTALEANPVIPILAVVTERLLHEESKLKSQSAQPSGNPEGALTSSYRRRLKCNYCHKPGHFKRNCPELTRVKGQTKSPQARKTSKVGAFKVTITPDDENTDSESTGLVVQHALSVGPDVRNQWIIDSGATCHMCNTEPD